MGYYDRDKYPNDLNATNSPVALTVGWPEPHLGNTGEYMISAWPFAQTETGTFTATFDYVSRWVSISAVNCDIEVTFQGGASKFLVPSGTTTGQLELKCTSVTLTAINVGVNPKLSLLAGLTNIKATVYPSEVSERDGIA